MMEEWNRVFFGRYTFNACKRASSTTLATWDLGVSMFPSQHAHSPVAMYLVRKG